MSSKIFIIDGYNFIYRLFYAVPPFTLKDGTPVNAVFGLAKVILNIYKEDKPDYLIFTLDHRGKKIREDIFSDYKGTRDKMPTDLKKQEDLIFDLLNAFEISDISIEGYEADDVIGTIVTRLKDDLSKEIFILSGDKDLYQFIDTNVYIYDTMKKKIYHKYESIEKFGVDPSFVVDYLAICGDSSDNIPGIPGFGPKKAQELITKFGNLEHIYDNIDKITGKTKDVLLQNREVAFMSKKLAQIHTNLDLQDFDIENNIFASRNIYTNKLIEFLKKYEFKSLLPVEHIEQMKTFENLNIKTREILNSNELLVLSQKISNLSTICISTHGSSFFQLEKFFINLGDKEIYLIDTDNLDIKDFLKSLIDSQNIEIVGFDLKTDLKRIWSYIENDKNIHNNNLIQSSLF